MKDPEQTRRLAQQKQDERASVEVVTRPVQQIQSPPFQPELADALVALLEAHGAQVERVHPFWIIRCPEGTRRSEIFPRTLEERHHLRFPDGYTVLETLTRDGLSRLSVDPQNLPEAVRVAQADVIHVLMGREPSGRADKDRKTGEPLVLRSLHEKEVER